MNIRTIEPFVVEQKLDRPFAFSQWAYDSRQVCLVKVTLEDGTYGWGEGYGPADVVRAGIDFCSPLVVGRDPLHVEAIWQDMYRRSLDFARRGVLLAALSAIDVALWDLRGKLLGQPVSVLLGGRRREKVRVYATGMYFSQNQDMAQELAEEAKAYVRQGFKAVKMKVGLGLEADLRNIAAVRNAIGAETALMIDANHAYSRSEARQVAEMAKDYGIAFFEEPLSPEDYAGYTELRTAAGIPIAAGECEYLTFGFRELAVNRCVDIAQPDICAAGGLTEVKRIVSLCHTFGINVLPHCWGTGIAFAAGLHLVSTLDMIPGRRSPPEPMLEMDRTENPLRDKLTVPRFEPHDGMVDVPAGPGLGVDVDPVFLQKYAQSGSTA